MIFLEPHAPAKFYSLLVDVRQISSSPCEWHARMSLCSVLLRLQTPKAWSSGHEGKSRNEVNKLYETFSTIVVFVI